MTVIELLRELRRLHINISADGDKLIVDAPSGAVTPPIADAIRGHKSALLELLSDLGRTGAEPGGELGRHPEENRLSLTQERIWAIDQLNPESGQFNLPGSWWLTGPLDLDRFKSAVDRFTARHDIFRRRFIVEDGAAVVSRPEFAGAEIHTLAVSEIGAHENVDAGILAWYGRISRQPFDLARDPLLRVYLLHVTDTRHLLLVVSHSAVWDAWCYDLFLSDLGALYDAESSGVDLEPLQHQYVDFVHWQRERQADPAVDAALRSAVEQLRGRDRRARLPLDRPAPDPADHAGARFNFYLPAVLYRSIKDYAQKVGATPFMVLLTSYAALLCRYTGQDSVLVTIPMRGRERRQFEKLCGPFTNNLFMPLDVARHTFSTMIALVKDRIGKTFGSEVPAFERLVESLSQDLANSGMFQLQFSYQNVEDRRKEWARDITLSAGPHHDFHATHADISFWVREGADAIDGAIDYRTAMFDETSIALFYRRMLQITEQGLRSPDAPIDELDLLERPAAMPMAHPAPDDALRRLNQALSMAGDRICLESRTGKVTASRLKDCLEGIGTGVPADCPSGLLPVVLALGTLAAGRQLVLDAGFAPACGNSVAANRWLRAVPDGAHGPSIRSAAQVFSARAVNLATSAWIERIGENERRVMIAEPGISPARVVSWLAVLASGGALYLPSEPDASDEISLLRLVEIEKPDLVKLPSAMLESLIALGGPPPGPRYLATIQPDASALAPAIASRALKVDFVIAADNTLGIGVVGSGRGWPLRFERVETGVNCRIVDRHQRAQLPGLDGSLALSIADAPLEVIEPVTTMRQDADGTPGWLDTDHHRSDRESWLLASLLAFPEVTDAHVATRGGNGRSLIAWISMAFGQELTTFEIRRRLSETTPCPPIVFVFVDEIARDGTGRVSADLPHPDVATNYAGYEPPSTQAEMAFAAVWRDVLGVERISVHNTFANLGGNSVQALVILSEAQRKLGWSFEPRLLFFQTLRQIVERTTAPPRRTEA